MQKVTKEMIIADVLKIDMNIAPILMNAGLHCLGCPSAQGETLEEAGMVHDMDIEKLVDEINQYLEANS